MRFKVNKTNKRENLAAVCDYDLIMGVVYISHRSVATALFE
jgi:hypothetical protein